MTDERTAEQIAADTALTEAVERCMRAYGPEDTDILTDFVVLCATQKINPKNGKVMTAHQLLLRDGDIPWYRVLGLLELTKTLVVAESFTSNDD